MTGWIGVRTIMLWPLSPNQSFQQGPKEVPTVAPVSLAEQSPAARVTTYRKPRMLVVDRITRPAILNDQRPNLHMATRDPTENDPNIIVQSTSQINNRQITDPASAVTTALQNENPAPVRLPIRWSLSSWILVRGETGIRRLNDTAQLGGSQIGFRLGYPVAHISKRKSLIVSARLSSALSTPNAAEASIGFGIKHQSIITSEILLERRVKLSSGGRNAVAVLASTGVNDIKILDGATLDGYMQTGFVGLSAPEAFADGSVRLSERIARSPNASMTVGVGAWGAAQRGVRRLDIGPQIIARLGGSRATVRVAAEWRFRMAGNARPSSGPSLSAGFDF